MFFLQMTFEVGSTVVSSASNELQLRGGLVSSPLLFSSPFSTFLRQVNLIPSFEVEKPWPKVSGCCYRRLQHLVLFVFCPLSVFTTIF